MEQQQLKYFVEVAKLEHITHAAQKLHISQPSVSLAIRRLEEELGVSLFDREGRNIKINNYGREFFETAVAALELLEQGQKKLEQMKYTEESHISISAPPWYIFPSLVEQIMEYNPNITITNNDHSDGIVADFAKRSLDFCITTAEVSNSGLRSVDLREEEMVLLVSDTHPLAGRKEIKLSECSHLPFAATSKKTKQYDILLSMCSCAGFKPNIMIEVNNIRDVIRMVEHSTSIVAAVPLPVLTALEKDYLPYIHLTDVDPKLMLRMYWSKDAQDKPTAKWVREKIIEYFSGK